MKSWGPRTAASFRCFGSRPALKDFRSLDFSESNMTTNRARWLTWLFSAMVLIPTILGFANKLIDLVLVAQGDEEGAFAITPIVNYLLATAGFLCLLVWTARQGAFRDLDGPSRAMFENERLLDARNLQPRSETLI